MKVYKSFKELIKDCKDYNIPMKAMFAEAFNQVFGRLTLLEKDHDRVIKENKELKKVLKAMGKIKVEKDGSVIMPKIAHKFFYDGQA